MNKDNHYDAVLMVAVLIPCIESHVWPVSGSPCHKLMKRIVKESGFRFSGKRTEYHDFRHTLALQETKLKELSSRNRVLESGNTELTKRVEKLMREIDKLKKSENKLARVNV